MRRHVRRAGLIGGFATALMVACSGGERGEDVGFYEEAVTDLILLNEIKVDPPGTTSGQEQFIELRGTPSGQLSEYFLLVLEGNGGENPGIADFVVNLGAACGGVCALGSNGLLLIKRTAATPADIPTTVLTVATSASAQLGFDLSNNFPNSASVLLVRSSTEIAPNMDYDTNNDGTLDLPTGATVLDAVGWRTTAADSWVYGGVALPLVGGTTEVPDALTRFAGNNTAKSAAAWFYGELSGTAASTTYDLANSSDNTPTGASLTPAAANVAEASGGAGGAGGAGGGGAGGESGGGVGGGGDGGVPPVITGGTGPAPVGGTGAGGDGGTDTGVGGGVPAGAGGTDAEGGTPGSGGASGGTAGKAAGGTATTAGTGGAVSAGTAGTANAAGRGGSGGTSATTGGKGGAAGSSGMPGGGDDDDDDDGCGCRTPGRGNANHGALAALALGFAAVIRRRRKTLSAPKAR